MAEISPAALFGRLAEIPYKTIESATEYCQRRGNPNVELAHWLHQILQQVNSDVHCAMQHFELDPAQLDRDLTRVLDKLPRGASSLNFSDQRLECSTARLAVRHLDVRHTPGAQWASADWHAEGPIICTSPWARSPANSKNCNADELSERFAEITNGSPEEQSAEPLDETGAPASDMAPALMGKQEALGRFTVDLTEQARSGKIDPIVGRDEEIRQVIDILMRRRQNNPILTGEAGVGKTAVVEGFAHRIVQGDVPPMLAGVRLLSLDIGLLQAGASMKGEFEQRLRQVIDEVQGSPTPIIMFIDEAHTLIGAGGSAGTGDAANLLKPALARGTLKTIAATTWAEYKKHIEKDPALTRRFQVVQVGEPDEERCVRMMRKLASTLEQHHRVQLLDAAIEAAVKLSHRYIPARQLPDKAVSVLDTACARVAVSQHSTPATLEYCQRRIESLDTELEIIEREASVGIDIGERKTRALEELAKEQERKGEIEARFDKEKVLVDEILGAAARAARRGGRADRGCGQRSGGAGRSGGQARDTAGAPGQACGAAGR